MISTMHRTTTQISSSLGMPACGHAFGRTTEPVSVERPWVKSAQTQATTTRRTADVVDTAVVRGGKGLGLTGDLGIAPTYFPGITAWSPPSC